MKISEAIQSSSEIIEELNTAPICMPSFIMSVCALMVGLKGLAEDDPKKGEVLWEASRGFTLHSPLEYVPWNVRLQGFFNWFIQLDCPESDDDIVLWYDFDFVAEKWNEYVSEVLK